MRGIEETGEVVAEKPVDYAGAKMGMWIFLFTELLLFGGMFLLYSVYRSRYASDFHSASSGLDIFLGAANTVVLLTSSLTMALSISALARGRKNVSLYLQGITVLLGILFLMNKYFEWSAHIHHGIYPDSPVILGMSRGTIIFFSLYYVMTGIHGLHVLIGVAAISVTAVLTSRGTISSGDVVKLENTGLYWHFVDIVWVYLFPLFYLIA